MDSMSKWQLLDTTYLAVCFYDFVTCPYSFRTKHHDNLFVYDDDDDDDDNELEEAVIVVMLHVCINDRVSTIEQQHSVSFALDTA